MPWTPGKVSSFEAAWPTAHSLAYLRFAESVTVSGARLATGRAGSPLAGRVSHPLDDIQRFLWSHRILHSPLDQPCLVALDIQLIRQDQVVEVWSSDPVFHCEGKTVGGHVGVSEDLHR